MCWTISDFKGDILPVPIAENKPFREVMYSLSPAAAQCLCTYVGPVLHIPYCPAVPTRCGLPQLWKQELLSQQADETHTAFTLLWGDCHSKEVGSNLYSGEKKKSTWTVLQLPETISWFLKNSQTEGGCGTQALVADEWSHLAHELIVKCLEFSECHFPVLSLDQLNYILQSRDPTGWRDRIRTLSSVQLSGEDGEQQPVLIRDSCRGETAPLELVQDKELWKFK